MPKPRTEDIDVKDVIECIDLNRGIVEGLLDITPDELAAVLAYIANIGNISTSVFKMARSALPSFSTAKWTDFALKIGLPTNPEIIPFTSYSTPRYRLPPSFQKIMFQNAWHWQDVYRETVDQTQEQARLRILEPYIVPIIALFNGRVIDKPEQAMAGTIYATGGEVEHEIFMIGGVLFFVIEFKLNQPDANSLAQLFLALLSAAEQNRTIQFAGLRVYGLLTNAVTFSFYSYDTLTKQFCFDETIIIANKRPGSLTDMVDVSDKIFGVILSAYEDGLHAIIKKSRDRAERYDFSWIGSSPEDMWKGLSSETQSESLASSASGPEPSKLTAKGRNGGRKSTDSWEAALAFAEACCEKFNEPVTSLEDIEKNGNDALTLLFQSVHSIPRASVFTGKDDELSTPSKLKDLADRLVNGTYETSSST